MITINRFSLDAAKHFLSIEISRIPIDIFVGVSFLITYSLSRLLVKHFFQLPWYFFSRRKGTTTFPRKRAIEFVSDDQYNGFKHVSIFDRLTNDRFLPNRQNFQDFDRSGLNDLLIASIVDPCNDDWNNLS
jgi:hypothetical protein